jgi:hypothetical protein
MCAGCAIAAAGAASGVRSWLQCHHLSWLTPRRLKAATAVLFAAATLVSSVGLSGSTKAPHPPPPSAASAP